MATLTIGLSGSSVINGSKSYTLSDSDIQLIINWAINKFSPRDITGTITTPLTPAQALLAWVQDRMATATIQEVKNYNVGLQIQAVTVPPVVFG